VRPFDRARFAALDALLAADEIAGFTLSNRPAPQPSPPASVVLIAERFPVEGDPLVDFALSLHAARVEAAARPGAAAAGAAQRLTVDYREDDGALERIGALIAYAARHPVRTGADVARRRADGGPSLLALAPAIERIHDEPRTTTLHALGGEQARRTAQRLAALTGRELR
jgi:hypothetical protein